MTHGNKNIIVSSLKLFDLIVMLLAFVLATVVPYVDFQSLSFSEFLAMKIKVQNFVLFSLFLLLWHGVFCSVGVYARGRNERGGQAEILLVVNATLYGAMAIWLVTLFVNVELMTLGWLIVFWAMACSFSILGRIALRAVLQRRRLSYSDLSHLVIVGSNARAVNLAKKIECYPDLGYHLVGFVDEHWSGEAQFRESGYSIVSNFKGFQDYLKDHVVDEVILCVPIKSLYDSSYRILMQCEQQGITVRFVSDLFTPTIGRSQIDRFEEQAVFTVNTGEMRGPGMLVKRWLDFCISLLLLIVLLPLLIAIAVAIKLDSSGPIFFVQERVGLNKRRFRLYKFRTMVSDAEKRLAELEHRNEVSGPVFKIKRDPRITRVGEFLRKTSLDELLQLINVVKGDMSLVGPRPLPVRDYRGFTENWHRRRFSVRPGITCLWQVCGRNSIPFERWMELDMQYIDQWSLMLDFKILLKTIPAVLKGSGAS